MGSVPVCEFGFVELGGLVAIECNFPQSLSGFRFLHLKTISFGLPCFTFHLFIFDCLHSGNLLLRLFFGIFYVSLILGLLTGNYCLCFIFFLFQWLYEFGLEWEWSWKSLIILFDLLLEFYLVPIQASNFIKLWKIGGMPEPAIGRSASSTLANFGRIFCTFVLME